METGEVEVFWLRSTRPQHFVVTIQRGVSSAKFSLLLLSANRMGGTAAYDKFCFDIIYLSDPSPIITLPFLSVSSKLDWCDSVMKKCKLKNCWCCSVVNVATDEECIIDSLVEKLKFGQYISTLDFVTFFEAEVWFRHGAQGLVKILKLKFGQYFEADAYLRFDNIWKYNWEQR